MVAHQDARDAAVDAAAGSGAPDGQVVDAAKPGSHRHGPSPMDAGVDGSFDASSDAGSATSFGTQAHSARIFATGHSLMDDPLLDDIVSIAQSLGDTAEYNEQIVIGSPIRVRTRGDDSSVTTWPGYSVGKNRGGSTGMDVIGELRNPKTLGVGEHYDTLLIAEREDVLDVVIWEDSVRYLRHFHERLIEGNARGTTYLFTTWSPIDRTLPAEFAAYERAALHAWECEAARVNESLAAENRSDRMVVVPTSGAMAELLDRAISSPGVAGITDTTPSTTVDRLFVDRQHVLPVGVYYTALVNYASIYHHSPAGAWAPSGIGPALATLLQTIAWEYVLNYYAHATAPTQAHCLALLENSFCPVYSARFNETDKKPVCLDYFSQTTEAKNGFYYNAATDAAYWFPAPP